MPTRGATPATTQAAAASVAAELASSSRENIGRAWMRLASMLRAESASASTTIGSEAVTALECFSKGLAALGPAATAELWSDAADYLDELAAARNSGGPGADRRTSSADEGDEAEEDDDDDNDDDEVSTTAVPFLPYSSEQPMTAVACRCRAVAAEPTNGLYWTLLGQALSSRADAPLNDEEAKTSEARELARVAEVLQTAGGALRDPTAGRPTPVDCFARALTIDVGQADAWFFVADELVSEAQRGSAAPGAEDAAQPFVTVVGKRFPVWQCLMEGLKRDPKGYAPAWIELARHMPRSLSSVRVGNHAGQFTRLQCVLQSLAIDEDQPAAWLTLGLLLQSGAEQAKCVEHARKRYFPMVCFVRSLEADSSVPEAWVALAAQLRSDAPLRTKRFGDANHHGGDASEPSESVSVAGTQVDALRCYAAALQLNPTVAVAWHGLGVELDARNVSTELVVGSKTVEVSAEECLVKAVEHDPDDGHSWHDLARVMRTGGTVAVAGWQRAQIDCFAEACRLEPSDALCWLDLAEALPRGGVVKVGEKAFAQLRCYAAAVRCDPKNAVAWANVGALLTPGATITLADQARDVTQIECYVRSLRLDRKTADVWRNLATAMRASQDKATTQEAASDDEGPDGEPMPEHSKAAVVVPVERLDVFGDGHEYDAAACDAEAARLDADAQ
jgi:cytochrome c-type biogenesis protein CcmH/NrfG